MIRTGLGPGAPRGLAAAQLQLGPHDVVLHDRGREVWLPGPAAGGVSAVVVTPNVVRLTDHRHRELLVLDTQVWCPTEADTAALLKACADVGISGTTSPVPETAAVVTSPLELGRQRPSAMMSPAERGEASVGLPAFALLTGLVLVPGSLAAARWSPLGWPLVVGSLALLAGTLGPELVRRRWDSSLRRTGTA